MIYEYRCLQHPHRVLVVSRPIHEQDKWQEGTCPECGEPLELDLDGHGGSWFNFTYGKYTGCYDYDYGKKATWDLTPKGKMQKLEKEGVIVDPFKKVAEKTNLAEEL